MRWWDTSDKRFIDLTPKDIGDPQNVRFLYNGKVVEVETSQAILRFAKRGLTQLLHAMGYVRRDLKMLAPDNILDGVKKLPENTVLSAFVDYIDEKKIYVVYRVTTDYYTPIQHRVLFDHVSKTLKDNGFNVEYKIIRYFTRTAARWLLWTVPMEFEQVEVGEALNVYLHVSNANTGVDSVKIFGYAEILTCKNGLTMAKGYSVRVFHVKDVNAILERVSEAVIKVVEQLDVEKDKYATSIPRLQSVSLTPDQIGDWMGKLYEAIPEKYHATLTRALIKYSEQYGPTAEAIFQTITHMSTRVRNETVHRKLDKWAHELLATVVR